MRLYFFLFLFFIASCGTESEIDEGVLLEGNWDTINIEENEVSIIGSSDDALYYVSGSKFFQLTFEGINHYQNELRFEAEDATIADFVNMKNTHLILGLRYEDLDSEDPIFYESFDNGNNWQIIEINYPDKMNHFIIGYLEKAGESTEHLIAYAGRVLESIDGGHNWSILFEEGSFSSFLYTDGNHTNQIWTGGDTAINSPYLAKSADGGVNWTLLNQNIDFATDAVVKDVILHHEHSDRVLAGLSGPVEPSNVVRRSTDGGENWDTVLEQTGVHVLTRSPQNPNLIYASGRDASTKLFFAWTTDFGDTWEKQIFHEGPDFVTSNDMAIMMIDGKETLFFGTDQGLFTFTVQ